MKLFPRSVSVLLLVLLLLAACGSPAATTPSGQTDQTAASAAASADAAASTEAAASAAAGDAASSAAASPAPTPTIEAAVVNPNGATKITWWHITTADPLKSDWQAMANAYTQQHPDVSIEINIIENEAFKTKLATAMQAGTPPDLFQSWGGGTMREYANAGLLKDLTADVQGEWGDSITPAALGVYSADSKVYGIPWDLGMVGFWYNKGLFQKAGIASPPQTWTEFLDAVSKLKAAGITPIALGEKDKWPGHFYWVYLATRLGGKEAFEQAYSRQGSFADESFVQAGQKLKELVDLQPFQEGYLGADYGTHQSLMGNGQAAMELMGQWAPSSDRALATDPAAYDANLGFFPFPSVEGGKGAATDVMGGGNGFSVGKNAPPETVDFLRFLTSKDNQSMIAAKGSIIPVVKGAETALTDPFAKQISENVSKAEYFQLYYDQFMPPAVGQAVNDLTQELYAGTRTPEEVAQGIEEVAATELEP
jgi:raffinose/stachyose/melibiose transport system substrate-binding protein